VFLLILLKSVWLASCSGYYTRSPRPQQVKKGQQWLSFLQTGIVGWLSFIKIMASPHITSHEHLTIRFLNGTSSFSNDTVWFTSFFVYIGDRICLHYFWGIKIWKIESSHFLHSFVLPGNRKTYTHLYGYCVYNQLQNIQPLLPT